MAKARKTRSGSILRDRELNPCKDLELPPIVARAVRWARREIRAGRELKPHDEELLENYLRQKYHEKLLQLAKQGNGRARAYLDQRLARYFAAQRDVLRANPDLYQAIVCWIGDRPLSSPSPKPSPDLVNLLDENAKLIRAKLKKGGP